LTPKDPRSARLAEGAAPLPAAASADDQLSTAIAKQAELFERLRTVPLSGDDEPAFVFRP